MRQRIKIFLALSLVLSIPISSEEDKDFFDKRQISYLLQSKEHKKSFDLYQDWKKKLGRHDFEILHQLALILLDEGARGVDPEKQLLSIFGASLAGTTSSWEILDSGINSPNPQTQIATIQLLGRQQDDHSDALLIRALSSDFFYARLEAAYFLSLRKHRLITGHLEGLMYRFPPEMRFFFPEYFALIGTADSIAILRHMLDEKEAMVRIEAVLSAGRFGRDDLLPQIRALATHLNIAEQEACAFALGELKDSRSHTLIKKLAKSPSTNVKLSALKTLYLLGDLGAKEEIIKLAEQKDLFAISTLGDIPDSQDALVKLATDGNQHIRFNATVALLKLRDPRVISSLAEFLIHDSRDLGFQPQFSIGKAHTAWKVIPSAKQHSSEESMDLGALALSVREYLLRLCLELPESSFLKIAHGLFETKQNDLIPLLVDLLENLNTEGALKLLKEKSQTTGAPLIRAYCSLALFRLRQEGPYEKQLLEWMEKRKESELIRFRPMALRSSMRLPECSFDLTPEENSRLLIDALEAFANLHEEKGIDLLFSLIQNGNPKNRPILAGLLLRTIQ
jgi:HEAT repeat protein